MSYFALVENDIVNQVIVADDDYISKHLVAGGDEWVQTDPNTHGNVHYGDNGEPDGLPPFRGNFACIGFIWDAENNVFYAPQPYPSWTLDTNTWTWLPPVPYPNDGGMYRWDEATKSWIPM